MRVRVFGHAQIGRKKEGFFLFGVRAGEEWIGSSWERGLRWVFVLSRPAGHVVSIDCFVIWFIDRLAATYV